MNYKMSNYCKALFNIKTGRAYPYICFPVNDTTQAPISLTIGTVETTDPGTQASASITGESPNFVLNLSIPQGPVGPAA